MLRMKLYEQLIVAFNEYVRTIPEHKKDKSMAYKVKDIVSRI